MQNSPSIVPKKWIFLPEKDSVEVIYPATGPLSKEHMEEVKKIIENYGLKVIYNEQAFNTQNAPFVYYANDLEGRVQNVINALEGTSPALWAFRGGFGSVEVIERLESLKYVPPSQPKIFIGASDITHFHALAAKWGWISFHAPGIGGGKEGHKLMPNTKINCQASLRDTADVLLGKKTELEYTFEVIYKPGTLLNAKVFKGSVIGGNATLVKEIQGTPTEMKTQNRFVFLEDTKEDPKRLNRVLVSLLRGGFFEKAQAILFGSLPIEDSENEREASLVSIRLFIEDHLLPKGLDLPVLYSPEFGHGDYNHVLPFGTNASLEIKKTEGILKVKTNEPFENEEKKPAKKIKI